jgi:hypothetical protein
MNRLLRNSLVTLIVIGGGFAVAGTLVVPGFDASVEGNTNNGYPFNISDAAGDFPVNAQRYQQIYDSTQFGGASGFIDAIFFRPDAVTGHAFNVILSSIEIIFSVTSATPSSVTTNFDTNLGPSSTVVYSGSLPISSAFTGPLNGPKDFDIVIHLQTPFFYDPSQGNLIMQVKNFGGGTSSQFDAEQGTTVMQRVENVDNNANGTTGIVGVTVNGLVTEFDFVPEPASIGLFAFGMIAIAVFARRRSAKRT